MKEYTFLMSECPNKDNKYILKISSSTGSVPGRTGNANFWQFRSGFWILFSVEPMATLIGIFKKIWILTKMAQHPEFYNKVILIYFLLFLHNIKVEIILKFFGGLKHTDNRWYQHFINGPGPDFRATVYFEVR